MGLIVSMSCLVSLGQGAGESGLMFIPAMVIALLLNICSAACMAELNALMPNATGGLVQYTLAGLGPLPTLVTMVGGYLICNILCGGVEAAIFGSVMVETIPLAIPAAVYPTIVSIIVAVAALKGVDIFAKLQDFVSYLLLFSMIALGLIGAFQLGTGAGCGAARRLDHRRRLRRERRGRGLVALRGRRVCHSHLQGRA